MKLSEAIKQTIYDLTPEDELEGVKRMIQNNEDEANLLEILQNYQKGYIDHKVKEINKLFYLTLTKHLQSE